MRSREYLNRAFTLKREIDRLGMQIERMTAIVEKCTSTISDMPKNAAPFPDSRERAIVRILDFMDEKYRKLDEFIETLRELDKTIGKVMNSKERLVLQLRYIDLNTWEKVAEIMGCSIRSVYRIHGKAVLEVEKILENENLQQLALNVT